ncbi:hypothetical protein [Nannocystis pusilla]|uniref:hypothetical protein n=1 Tax=Nannocystis pusilla TaxID=889268 RepID=UPI001CCE2373|nr:hypothetical protein [Nannocystis pusilla]
MAQIFDMEIGKPLPPTTRQRLSRGELAALVAAVGASAMMVGAIVGYSAGVLSTLAQHQNKRNRHAV